MVKKKAVTPVKRKKAKRKASTGLNKSQAIRDFYKKNPNVGPTAIAKALQARYKTTFSPAQVSNVLSNASGKKKKVRRKTKRKVAVVDSSPTTDLRAASDHLLQAVELVASAGAKEAKQLIAMAEKLVAKVRK